MRVHVCLQVTFCVFFFFCRNLQRQSTICTQQAVPAACSSGSLGQGRDSLCSASIVTKGRLPQPQLFSAAAALRLLMLTANNVLLDDCAAARSHRGETETNRGSVKEGKTLCWRGAEDEFPVEIFEILTGDPYH